MRRPVRVVGDKKGSIKKTLSLRQTPQTHITATQTPHSPADRWYAKQKPATAPSSAAARIAGRAVLVARPHR